MLIELYMFLASLGVVSMFIAFFRPDVIIFGFMAALLFGVLGVVSGGIQTNYCTYSSAWLCYQYSYSDTALMLFWYGMGLLMTAYSIYMAIWGVAEDVVEAAGGQSES